MDTNAYKKYVESRAKRSPVLRNCIRAFWVGGALCCVGQGLNRLYQWAGLSEKHAGLCVSVTLIFLAGLFTGIGWFDKLAKYAGAGTLVPITGFANSVAAPAVDAKSEGYVTGVAAKMFTIAGPVIVYGSVSSILYGVIYYFFLL
ncbi:MAG: stage V sporulation protein AC [Oscillospiraceae bacterium]|nr:stage V sporulation protein AC [Oscillospiraceae bacterium]